MRGKNLLIAVACAALVAQACGSDDGGGSSSDGGSSTGGSSGAKTQCASCAFPNPPPPCKCVATCTRTNADGSKQAVFEVQLATGEKKEFVCESTEGCDSVFAEAQAYCDAVNAADGGPL